MSAPWPLARLTFDRDVAVITVGPLARSGVMRSRVLVVARQHVFLGDNIRFVSRSGEYDSTRFWTSDAPAVLRELRAFGWPVSTEPETGLEETPEPHPA